MRSKSVGVDYNHCRWHEDPSHCALRIAQTLITLLNLTNAPLNLKHIKSQSNCRCLIVAQSRLRSYKPGPYSRGEGLTTAFLIRLKGHIRFIEAIRLGLLT